MPATLDLPAVRRFTDDINARIRQCENGDGAVCSSLDKRIQHYVQLCGTLRAYVNQWARAVFTGQVVFDAEVEAVLKGETKHLLHRAKQVAALGRAMDERCFRLEQLAALHHFIADLDYLQENWVSPRLAVSPAPRVTIPDAAAQEIRERLETLPPLPSDWRPTDPEQLAFFQKQRAK